MSEIPAKRARTDTEKKLERTECRACLAKLYDDSGLVDIFRAWNPAWSGMGLSIAEDLAKLTNIEINVSDPLSKSICQKCCSRLQNAIKFTIDVQTNDAVQRELYKCSVDENPLWPKPIQVDKNITSDALNEMSIEVKQEVLTEDEYESNELPIEPFNEDGESKLEIKIEPEEITPNPVDFNGPYSLSTDLLEAKENGVTTTLDESTKEEIKNEPISEDEAEPPSDMPEDCMLCLKTFHNVDGLKAHVIAVHSYDSVTSARERPHVCTTCNRSFTTRTDLFVHETCHSQFVCYVCDMKFDTFHLLTQHRSKQCTKTRLVLPRLKTLDDVRRPVYLILNKTKSPKIPTGSEKMSQQEPASQIKNEETNLASNVTDQVEGEGHNKTNKEQKRSLDEQSERMNEVEQLLEEIHRETPEKSNEVKTKSSSKMLTDDNAIAKESLQSKHSATKTNVIEDKLNSLVANGSEKQEIEIHLELENESIDSKSCDIQQPGASCIKDESIESNSTDNTEKVDAIKELSEDINNIKDEKREIEIVEETDISSFEVSDVMKENAQEATTIERICKNENSLESEGIHKQSVESCTIDAETTVQKNDENDKNFENLELKLPIETSKANLSEDMDIQSDIHSMNEAMDIDESEIKNINESDKLI